MSLSVRGRVDDTAAVLRAIVREFKRENISFMAGSIAYSAFVSLLPMILLALLVATIIGGQAFADRVIALTGQYLTPTAQGLVADSLSQASQQTGFSLLGIAVLLWSALKVFRGLDVAFSSLYHTPRNNSIIDQVMDGMVVLVGIGVGVPAMVAAGFVTTVLPGLPFAGLVSFVSLIVALTIALYPMYYVFPDQDVTVREVLPGVLVAAVGWTLLQSGFELYIRFSSTSDVSSVLGAVILLVTWLYFGALVLLIGAATNVVLSDRSEAARPTPNPEGARSPE